MKPLYRILINWYQASDKELPAWLQRACQKDPSLAQERAFGETLTRELRKPRSDESASFEGDSMAARVLKQIAEEDYHAAQEEEASPLWGAWVRNAGMGVAALAVVFAAYQYLDTDSQIEGGEIAAIQENATATDGLLEISEDWKNPLDQEIEYIVSDAKGALGFLANTFVPSTYLKEKDKA